MTRVLVTGGAGFIGKAVVERLRAEGQAAFAGLRRGAGAPPSRACDLDDPGQIAAALDGVDAVIHAAYGDSAAMEAQCRRLLDAMARAGTRRLVHFSSIAVYGDATGAVDETAPLAALDAYGAAKIACEARVARWAAEGHGRALILRPGIVYGRGGRFWIDKLTQRIRAGGWGTFGADGEGLAALVHVDDVAAVVCGALNWPEQDGEAVAVANLVGPQAATWNAYFAALAAALGAPPLPVLDAAAVTRAGRAALAAKLWRKTGLPGFEAAALAPTAGERALFARKADYRTDAAARLCGVNCEIDMAEGLRRSV